jgi:uncharacterized protein YyaL (SSP411 family)
MLKKLCIGVILTMAQAHNKYTNHLINEDSPYLQQHAHNPIEWYPWGDAAFSKAKKENKLIFLSIGYSTCHWCHVMERESFENEQIAKYMNAHYVNIKVDREELPHIDSYYQDVYMLLNKRSGGWPLTIIMTPDKKPFYAATYLPPDNRYGRPGLLGMAQYLYETFRDKKENVYKSADSVEEAMQSISRKKKVLKIENIEGKEIAKQFVSGVREQYDFKYKGIGTAPKFPHATTLGTLLTIYRLTKDKDALLMADEALEAMAKGGIYDQIEGGFYRYSVDEAWIVPHFEKMLYTNAELIDVYTDAYMLTHNLLYKEVIDKSVTNMRERFQKEGCYFSASDADSDGEEGKYFVFTYNETLSYLQKEGFSARDAKAILTYLGITPSGNFEGRSNPHITQDQKPEKLKEALDLLKKYRQRQNYPFIDYKIQTSWNALYLEALLKASNVEPHYRQSALDSLEQLLSKLYIKGILYHQVVLSKKPKIKGYLEDYAFLISALITAEQMTLDTKYLSLAEELMQKAISKFYKEGEWYMSEDQIGSADNSYDTSYRSAASVMLENIFRIANLTENHELFAFAKEALLKASAEMYRSVQNFPTLAKVYLGYSYGWTLLKGDKEALLLHKTEIAKKGYPFLLIKASEEKQFLACKIDRCFAIDQKLEHVLEKIE